MKTGLIMEGGAMRGMFTAGVTDILMENHIEFDGAIGVSAGAAFGCNYKSRQPGRVIRYNTRYCRNPNYAGIYSWLKSGDLYGEQLCYKDIPSTLDPFDSDTFKNSPMEFYVVCTDVKTGKAVYHKCENGDYNDLTWMRASASMPIVSNIVNIDEYSLLDGGIADSIPAEYFMSLGYSKNVVILTQPLGFNKPPTPMMHQISRVMKKYPAITEALEKRHIMYNNELEFIKKHELSGELFVIRPSEPIHLKPIEKNPSRLAVYYNLGRRNAEEKLAELKAFLANS